MDELFPIFIVEDYFVKCMVKDLLRQSSFGEALAFVLEQDWFSIVIGKRNGILKIDYYDEFVLL